MTESRYGTHLLADYVHGLRATALTPPVRDAVLRCVLDLLGAAAAGLREPAVAGVRRAAKSLYAGGDAPVWFTADRLSEAGAVLCNSAAASALDLDDGNRAAHGHPGAAVIPAALAVAASHAASAEDFMLAVVAGYEVGVRVAAARHAAKTTVSRQSGRWTGYAAVAAAARLKRTPPAIMAQAFAIAGVTAPNQEANGSSGYSRLTGNDVKEGIAWSAAGGLSALALAEAGLTGPADILDHDTHFSQALLLGGLGDDTPRIGETYFKPYSCCRYNRAAIDAFAGLMQQHQLAAQDVLAVEVHTFGWALKLGNKIEPQNLVDVQYSIPYCLAVAVVEGAQALTPVGEALLNRADLSAWARKVRLIHDAALDARFPHETLARVMVRTRHGEFASPVTTPCGEPSNPLSWETLCEKFRAATSGFPGEARQQSLLEAVDALSAGDLQPLLHACAQPHEIS